jgi:hypothetical protein
MLNGSRMVKWASVSVLIAMLVVTGFAVRELPGIKLQNSVHTWLSPMRRKRAFWSGVEHDFLKRIRSSSPGMAARLMMLASISSPRLLPGSPTMAAVHVTVDSSA